MVAQIEAAAAQAIRQGASVTQVEAVVAQAIRQGLVGLQVEMVTVAVLLLPPDITPPTRRGIGLLGH